MKQMSRQELQCFLEFAPHYFRYVNKALDEQVCHHVTGCDRTFVSSPIPLRHRQPKVLLWATYVLYHLS